MYAKCKIILEGTLIISNLKMINKMLTFPPRKNFCGRPWMIVLTRFRFFLLSCFHSLQAWVRLNRLRTGVGRFRSCQYKCVRPPPRPVNVVQNKPSTMSSSTVQSIDPHGLHDLTVQDDETTEWLLNTCPDI